VSEILKKCGRCDNGGQRKILKDLIKEHNCDTSKFGSVNNLRKYDLIEKECPICKVKFFTRKGEKKEKTTCSISCSNSYFYDKRYSNEINKKRRIAITKYHENNGVTPLKTTLCKVCSCEFLPKRRSDGKQSVYCSRKCASVNRKNDPEYIRKLKESQNKRVLNGTHVGWKSRAMPSYAELFFMDVLRNNEIEYEFEKHVGKYFIDFAINSKNIALEIDGKQHSQKDRSESDKLKDEYLKSIGWKVYRIKWKSINSEIGKSYIKTEINKFLKFYKSSLEHQNVCKSQSNVISESA
jgi:very-short-patch-repair endonuclease